MSSLLWTQYKPAFLGPTLRASSQFDQEYHLVQRPAVLRPTMARELVQIASGEFKWRSVNLLKHNIFTPPYAYST